MGRKAITLWSDELKAAGMAEGIHMVIEGSIKQNIPTEVIAKAAGVTPAEVEAIKASMSVNA